MKLPRRQLLHLVAGAAALTAVSRNARAQTYPTRLVRIVVGYPPGGGTDIFLRLISHSLAERLGQAFVVENQSGAASNIATQTVVRAPADGYTVLGVDAAAAINATLYDKLNFNFIRDIAVVGIIQTPLVMVVHPSVPANTVLEFIAYAKANAGKINYASSGSGTPLHLAGELFKAKTEIDMTHVPYRGGAPAITDLLGGQVQVLFTGVPPVIEHIRAGRLRALAVTTAARFELLPDIPTMSDFLPGYDASQWYAAGLRKNTPTEIVDKLAQEIDATLADPGMKAKLAVLGGTALAGSHADFDNFVADETEKWAKVIKFAGVRPI